jgi:hypothetical protein
MKYYDPIVESFRKAGMSNCAGFVFHKLGLEPKDHYVSKKQAKAYLSNMKISDQPVDNSVLVVKGTLHLSLVKRTKRKINVEFRDGRGINKPIQTMSLKEFLSRIALRYRPIEYRVQN